MGYDLANFVDNIDIDFVCAICSMVMENPAETPCEHIFCSKCIKGWIAVDPKCPVDRQAIRLVDLRPAPKYFRSLLEKRKVRCEFEPFGCQSIIPLRCLQDHQADCVYKTKAAVICDNGCNMIMTRREYKKDCSSHLTNKFNDQLEQMREEMKEQLEELRLKQSIIGDAISRQNDAIEGLLDEMNRQKREIQLLRLNDLNNFINFHNSNNK